MDDTKKIHRNHSESLSKTTKNNNNEALMTSLDKQSCHGPLGMEHGHINDEDITASSAFDFKSVGPQNARYY